VTLPGDSNVFIVIPAFNEESAVFDVVNRVREAYPNVIVIDDGSSDGTLAEAKRAGAIALRHVVNRGQGAALQTGIEFALRRRAGVIVTFDADGQHRVEDIARLVEALATNDADIAIGSRFLELRSNVPAVRRFTLRTAALFMRLTSGVALTDAHNGLRAIRARAAKKIRLTIDGMAHASEIVDQIYTHGMKVVEVPVVIQYTDYSLRKGQSSGAAFRIAFDYLMKRLFR
jgi:glycosyltransferase involved in cell wall biosynthesis